MRGTDLVGLLGHTLFWGQLGLLIAYLCGLRGRARAVGVLVGFGLCWFPWYNGLSLVHVARGLVGDLSIVTVLLAAFGYLRALGMGTQDSRSVGRVASLTLVVLLASFYASALGLWHVDLYAAGYQPRALLLGLAVVLGASWCWERDLALALLSGLACWELGLMESTNLWDYLADPVLLVAAGVRLLVPNRWAQGNRVTAGEFADGTASAAAAQRAA